MGLFDGIFSAITTQQTMANDRIMQNKEQAYNTEMWNLQNEYNTPSNQIQRLKDAGINPGSMLMNGGQVQANNSAAQPLPFTPISRDYGSTFANLMSALSGSRLSNATAKTENRMREVRYKNVLEQNDELRSRVRNLDANSTAQEIANEYAHARELWSLRESRSRVELNAWQSAVYKQQEKRFKYELENILPADLARIISEEKVNIMNLDLLTARIADYYASVEERKQNVEESKAREGLLNEQEGLVAQQAKTEEQNTEYREKENLNYQAITDKVIEQYGVTIDNISEQTNLTKEQVFWYDFDEADKLGSVSVMGSKIPFNRFRNRKQRDKFEGILKNRLREKRTVYYPDD